MANYTVNAPILLLIFNRPDTTRHIFAQIKKAMPARLYIAADGPRPGHKEDQALCREAREIMTAMDWDCTVSTLFRDDNLGCKNAVASAISWFFQHEEEGIILEDDCLPADDFFYFCDNLLARYRHDTRVRSITGSNQQQGKQWGNASYYFSQCSNIWGWASWQRVWNQYDRDMAGYNETEVATLINKIFTDRFLIAEWIRVFKELKSGNIDTWDYQFHLINYFQNGLCAVPNSNLISNIGFRADATHTRSVKAHSANLPTGEIGQMIHPANFVPEKEADYFLLSNEFYLEEQWKRYNKTTKRLKRWLKTIFK